MILTIKNIAASTFVGKHLEMSIQVDKTGQLWGSFMPQYHLIQNLIGKELYSIECYPNGYFDRFQAKVLFQKWAAVKVNDAQYIPEEMRVLEVPAGQYAVFIYRGMSSSVASFYGNIFTKWIPEAGYLVDHRPHFAVMGENYRSDDPNSEEAIWIPIKKL